MKFDFDTSRTRAADEDVEWQVTHNRPASTMHDAAQAMACGGGKEQMTEDPDEAIFAHSETRVHEHHAH